MGVKQNVRLLNTLIIEQYGFKVLWFNYSKENNCSDVSKRISRKSERL